mgnify:CR=1 FL=1
MRINKLDGLRGIFSIMIVLLHYPKQFIPDWFTYNFFVYESYVFVDFFFVLSGFVIAYNYNVISSFAKLKEFLKKRLIRLYPLLLFTATIFLLVPLISRLVFPGYFISEYDYFTKLGGYIETITFMNITPVLGDKQIINSPSWSISAEIMSYLLYGFVIYKFKKYAHIFFLFIIIISLCLLFVNGDYFDVSNFAAFRGFVGFNLGYFVYKFKNNKLKINSLWEWISVLIMIIFMFILNTLDSNSLYRLLFGMFFIPTLFALMIYIFIHSSGSISMFLNSKPLQYLGRISYSLYLNHFIIPIIIIQPFFTFFKIKQSLVVEIIVLFFILAITILYSHFTFKFIEKKLGQFLKEKYIKIGK